MNAGTLQAQTTGNSGKLAGCLFWVALSCFSVALSAQEPDEPDAPAESPMAPTEVGADSGSDEADAGAGDDEGLADLSELTDEEAARKATEAREEAERAERETEQKRQEAAEAQDRADRVQGVQEKVQAEAVEGPPEATDQMLQESTQSAAEAADQEAAQQEEAVQQAEQEQKETSAQAEVLEKAADPEQGVIFRALHDEAGRLFGFEYNATLAIDGAKYQSGTALAGDSGFDVRRARVGLYRGFGANWYLRMTVEISSQQLQLRDNFLGYRGWSTALLQFGIFSEPFSLESMTSLNNITFMETALPVAALAPGKGVGLGATKRTKSGIFKGMLSFQRPKQEGNVGEEGQAITLRFVRSPLWRPEAQSTHFGVSLSYRINATEDGTRYRTRPESTVTDTRLVDTGNIEGADQIARLGVDWSRSWGPTSVQTEIMGLQVKRSGSFEDVTFWGGYVFASWFPTGEARNYRDGSGVYGPVKPLAPLGGGGKGAFELAARFSYLDVTDKDIIGGEETNITAGLNWYPKENWRFSANLIKVLELNRPGDELDGQEPWIFTIRGQYRFDW